MNVFSQYTIFSHIISISDMVKIITVSSLLSKRFDANLTVI